MGLIIATNMITAVLFLAIGCLIERRAQQRRPFRTVDHTPDREPLR